MVICQFCSASSFFWSISFFIVLLELLIDLVKSGTLFILSILNLRPLIFSSSWSSLTFSSQQFYLERPWPQLVSLFLQLERWKPRDFVLFNSWLRNLTFSWLNFVINELRLLLVLCPLVLRELLFIIKCLKYPRRLKQWAGSASLRYASRSWLLPRKVIDWSFR